MAEDGIEDYALAKRKAARQAGVRELRQLPTNEEIDAALRSYRDIYHQDEQRERLRQLRAIALRVMRGLDRFNPHLTGSVLNGNAGKYADIDLQLFTDNPKAVELHLIGHDVAYRLAQTRLYVGGELCTVPVYTLTVDGVEVVITLLGVQALRGPVRSSQEGKAIDRAKLPAVEQLLTEN